MIIRDLNKLTSSQHKIVNDKINFTRYNKFKSILDETCLVDIGYRIPCLTTEHLYMRFLKDW